MAKKDTDQLRPTPAMLIADLKARGGFHKPWDEVEGARYGSVLRAALKQGVEITEDGGLKLKGHFRTQGPAQIFAGDGQPDMVEPLPEGTRLIEPGASSIVIEQPDEDLPDWLKDDSRDDVDARLADQPTKHKE